MEFSSFPKKLAYAVKTLSGFSKSTVKLLPDNRTNSVQSGDIIRVRLPQNSLVDLRTFTMYYDGSTESDTSGNKSHFPRLSSSIIETLTIFVNGTQIFDKLNKRTGNLTTKNPLNNVLTNDQLFRYYIQEVEPKLSQSNDNFSGLPNMTSPDNSIKDTTKKGFGNGKDEYNTGTGGGGGGFGPLNSNDISQPSTSFQNYPLIERLNGIRRQHGEEAEKDVLFNWYTKDRQLYNVYIDENTRLSNNPVDVVDTYTHADIFSRTPYPLPETVYDRYNREERIVQQEYDDNETYTTNLVFGQIGEQQSNLQRVLQQLRKSDKTLKQDEVWLFPYPQQEISQQEITQQEIVKQVQELGFEPEAENEIWRNYGRPETDWAEAGIDEETVAGMDFPDYNSGYPSRYPPKYQE
jgi:hypothetical protein